MGRDIFSTKRISKRVSMSLSASFRRLSYSSSPSAIDFFPFWPYTLLGLLAFIFCIDDYILLYETLQVVFETISLLLLICGELAAWEDRLPITVTEQWGVGRGEFNQIMDWSQLCFLITLTQMNENSIAYLVYFNCRGVAHYYRYVIYEIGLPFEEIHIGNDGLIPESIRHFNITLADIPCVIYEGRVIKELYPTIRFMCRKFGREDLLGVTLREQTIISEIYCKSAKKKSSVISTFLKYVPKIKKEPGCIREIKLEMIRELSETPGCSQICSLLYSQTGSFIFDHLTVADFLFYENCFYFCCFFEDVCRRRMPILFAYKNFFERTDFYLKHKDKIQHFKFVVPEFDEGINEGFKLMCRDKKFLS